MKLLPLAFVIAATGFCEILTQNTMLKALSLCQLFNEDHTINVGADGPMAFLSDHQFATKVFAL
jgi:hypothetical protein